MAPNPFLALLMLTNPLLAAGCGTPAPREVRDAGEGDAPVELGAVDWGHDHDAAFARAAESGRPVLLLFQEIPG